MWDLINTFLFNAGVGYLIYTLFGFEIAVIILLGWIATIIMLSFRDAIKELKDKQQKT